jgi:S-adenosylmethionine hydrolase
MDPVDQVWELTQQEYMLPNLSTTFHGRDVFAPVAAYAALRVEANAFGQRIIHTRIFLTPTLTSTTDGRLTGEILYSDRFGNVLTSLGKFVEIR